MHCNSVVVLPTNLSGTSDLSDSGVTETQPWLTAHVSEPSLGSLHSMAQHTTQHTMQYNQCRMGKVQQED